MTPQTRTLEHRWGTRIPQHTPVQVRTAAGTSTEASVESASLSGAYLTTTQQLPLYSRLSLRPTMYTDEWLDASVVRVEEDGVAVEWHGWPGLRPLTALLSAGRTDLY